VLREIDFPLKICDCFLACFTSGLKLLEYRYVQVCKFESSQKGESRAQSADSSKAHRKPSAFNNMRCAETFPTMVMVYSCIFVTQITKFSNTNAAKGKTITSKIAN